MPNNKEHNKNFYRRDESGRKARAEKEKKEALAFRHSENSTKPPQKNRFFSPGENIHNDVNTTYKTSKRPTVKRKRNVSFNRPAVLVIALLIAILFLYFAFVLFQMQVQKHDEMTELANNQYYRKVIIPPRRGDILDRNGKVLATTINVFRIGVTPKHVYSLIETQGTSEIIDTVSGLLSLDKDELKGYLDQKDASYIQIAKDVPQEKADLLDQYLALNQIGGFRLDAEPKRIYLNEDVASQVVGFCGLNGDVLEGRLGIEYQMNDVLSGSAGYSYGARDNYLNSGVLPFSESAELAAMDGQTVTLTIDDEINKKLQEQVKEAVDLLGAKSGGMGLVLNVNTGEVLAMASYPYFRSADPTAKQTALDFPGVWNPENTETINFLSDNYWRNKVISEIFEVGSTFKTLTLAMGLEENVSSEETYYDDAPIDVLDYTIKCWSEEGHGYETLSDAFLNSCNPPFVQVSLDLGVDKFYEYIDAFGFNQLSGVELPGEAKCIFHENPSKIDLATLSFGEQSGFNLMSYAKGMASVVNGGNLMTPHIIKQITNADGGVVSATEPQIERRVISQRTSQRVNKLLARNDILQGINKVTAGYQLGGKTSTSVNEYTDELTMSYAGIAPIDNPEILTIIVAQEVDNGHLGSNSLINNVSGMVDFTLDHLHIARHYQQDQIDNMQTTIQVPDLTGQTLEQLKAELNRESVEVYAGVPEMKPDDYVAMIVPASGTSIHYGSRIYAYPTTEIPEDPVAVPDFKGKNYNECLIAANSAGLVLQFSGDMTGLAVEQSIAPSTGSPSEDPIENPTGTDEDNSIDPADQQQSEAPNMFVQKGTVIKITLQSEAGD